MTACMKNVMGTVWDRGAMHKNDLHQCIADAVYFRKPDLCVLDAYMPMVRNGPVGKDTNDLVERKTLLASRDIVAIDAAGAALLNKAGKFAMCSLGRKWGWASPTFPGLISAVSAWPDAAAPSPVCG